MLVCGAEAFRERSQNRIGCMPARYPTAFCLLSRLHSHGSLRSPAHAGWRHSCLPRQVTYRGCAKQSFRDGGQAMYLARSNREEAGSHAPCAASVCDRARYFHGNPAPRPYMRRCERRTESLLHQQFPGDAALLNHSGAAMAPFHAILAPRRQCEGRLERNNTH